MNTNPIPDELQAALTRLIEGEAEPHDDALVAELLRTHPDLRAQMHGRTAPARSRADGGGIR
jgi:hypothetical protein